MPPQAQTASPVGDARLAEHRRNLQELKENLRAQFKELSDAPEALKAEVMELRGEVSLLGIWQQEHLRELGDLRDLPQTTRGQLAEVHEELARLGARLEAQGSQLRELPRSLRSELRELVGEETSQLRVRQQSHAAQLKELQAVQETEGRELRSVVARLGEGAAETERLADQQEQQALSLQRLELLEAEERSKLRVEVCEVLAQELASLRREMADLCSASSFQRLEADALELRERVGDQGVILEGLKCLDEDVRRLDCNYESLARDFAEYQDDMLLRDRTLSAACRSGTPGQGAAEPSAHSGGLLMLHGRAEQLEQALEAEAASRKRAVGDVHAHVAHEIAEVRRDVEQRCREIADGQRHLQHRMEELLAHGGGAAHGGSPAGGSARPRAPAAVSPASPASACSPASSLLRRGDSRGEPAAAKAAEPPGGPGPPPPQQQDHLAALRSRFPAQAPRR